MMDPDDIGTIGNHNRSDPRIDVNATFVMEIKAGPVTALLSATARRAVERNWPPTILLSWAAGQILFWRKLLVMAGR